MVDPIFAPKDKASSAEEAHALLSSEPTSTRNRDLNPPEDLNSPPEANVNGYSEFVAWPV